ncbi:NLR family CARD domain-containing protein 3-like [Betta splendens]|uniref:NLR family CARD domain-containing protein 3-like n=1 Tax=Betta splendens TaxID=158456 RepID=A0A6P7N7P0_BETSP|nr:NLR family CARD domain-containing protein 3-like [Betta splendens]
MEATHQKELLISVQSGKKSPSLQQHVEAMDVDVETASSRQEEEMCLREDSRSVLYKNKTMSSCLSDTHNPSSVNKEAAWVDKNRAKLIQNVSCVMPIAEEMFQQEMIHKEVYEKIKAAGTPMDKMRELYSALTTTTTKSAFYNILHEMEPAACQGQDVIEEIMEKHKVCLRNRFGYEYEGTEKDSKKATLLDKIYTELHIVQGESKSVNTDHEIWEIQDKTRHETDVGTKINCNNIFKSPVDEDLSSGGSVRPIRTVMTKGIAGIGKTVSVKKFILDWAKGEANQDVNFIVVLPFRELNLVTDDPFSLETLVKEFHPELKNLAIAKTFADHKVMFIFDGLDESQLQLNFKKTKRLTDATKVESVDTIVTNIIRVDKLLPSAMVWITSRPGAVHRIPREYVHQWTEVRGFNETQKIAYFRKRIEDKTVAEKVISHILTSRSLLIMCHIPIFCWITAKVLQHLLPKMNQPGQIPTTLTEMYTHFLSIQMQVADKYSSQDEPDVEEMFSANEEFIFKLGRLAFEQLEKSKIIFTANDVKSYGIDINKAAVCSGLCTEILKEEDLFNQKKKLYCFVHLTVQEFFAALFVYRSFVSKKIVSPALKDFMLKGSDAELKAILDADPVDETLDTLIEIVLANSTQRKSGELDMFLRFLVGLSLESTQELLQGLIEQTDDHSEVVESIKMSLLELDLLDCSPERCLNLVHCLIELKDSSIHDTVQQYLTQSHRPELSPVQCSALADSILMSNEPLDEFNLMKYRTSVKGIFRLIPAVRNCRKAILSGVDLNVWICEAISSALRMPNSMLTELHLLNNDIYDKGTTILIDGIKKCSCKLQALSLSGSGLSQSICEKLASAVNGLIPNIRELELSGDVLLESLHSVLSVGLRQPKLEKLRLNRNTKTGRVCEELMAAFTSGLCNLRELDLSYSLLRDSELVDLATGLMSKSCVLEVLSLSHNRLTDKGCETLASVLSCETSHLRELDLSYNDLRDCGVMTLCDPLKKCGLKCLRLSFCKVTVEACVSLASALRSGGCSLTQLELSFNHLTDRGVELLMEIQKDSSCSLEILNTENNEDCWFDLKLLRKYACDLTLDSNSAGVNVILSKGNKMAAHVYEEQAYPEHPDRFESSQVLCEEGLTGRHYWEAECESADVGVAYRSMLRKGDSTSDFTLGHNDKSWCWIAEGHFKHNSCRVDLVDSSTHRSTIGVYLDWGAGVLSFFEVFGDELTLIYTVSTTFTEPLHPGFNLYGGSVCLCEIK